MLPFFNLPLSYSPKTNFVISSAVPKVFVISSLFARKVFIVTSSPFFVIVVLNKLSLIFWAAALKEAVFLDSKRFLMFSFTSSAISVSPKKLLFVSIGEKPYAEGTSM